MEILFENAAYRVGDEYPYASLPESVKRDLALQEEEIESVFDLPPSELDYRLVMIPSAEAGRILAERGAERLLEDPGIRKLARRIARTERVDPPVGEEGLDRIAALALLGRDIPYFMVLEPSPAMRPPRARIPTLEGRRRGRRGRGKR